MFIFFSDIYTCPIALQSIWRFLAPYGEEFHSFTYWEIKYFLLYIRILV